MRIFLTIILTGLLVSSANAQVSFSPVESKLSIIKSNDLTELVCTSPAVSIKFSLKRKLAIMPQNNFCEVGGQTIQITPLKINSYKKDVPGQSPNSEKQLLEAYSKYELDYFKNDLHIELINSSNQWVVIKAKGWFIWYFKVGNVPAQADKPTKIQLFASTVIGDNILTINAPVFTDDDFTKAGLIVNDMMETSTITK